MRLLDAELVESRQILPRQWLQRYRAPWLVAGARAGQFVHVRTPDYSGLVLRRPFSINTVDRNAGEFSVHFRVYGKGTEVIARAHPGDRLGFLGPLGRPFEMDPRTQHVLLVAGGLGDRRRSNARRRGAGGRAARDPPLRRRRTRLSSTRRRCSPTRSSTSSPPTTGRSATTGPSPSSSPATKPGPTRRSPAARSRCSRSLPGSRAAATRGSAWPGWAGSAEDEPLPSGSTQARRKSWLQVALEQNMGCAVGACLGCVVWGVGGPVRVCREGPVLAADEIAWEEPA